ncbi:MAG: hypothetical protein AB8G18_10200 [Gammaproteobacteria bacterium]
MNSLSTRQKSSWILFLLCLPLLASCAIPPEPENVQFDDIMKIAFKEHQGNRGNKAFAIGTLGDHQVFGISYEWSSARQAADLALQECRTAYKTQIGGPDNCFVYALNQRLCERNSDCVTTLQQENEDLSYEAREAFEIYTSYKLHKAFVIGKTSDYQVWGFSKGWSTEHEAVDFAMNECKKSFKARIGGPDNCVLYALNNRVCDELCLY